MAKKGKWEDIIKTLPRFLGHDPDFRAKVNLMKDSILNTEDGDLPSEVIEDMVDEITALQKVLNDALIGAMNKKQTGSHLARIYRDIKKTVKVQFNEQEKVTNILIEAYEELLIEQYENEGVKSLTLMDGRPVRVQGEPYAVVKDPVALRAWAIANDYGDRLTLPWQTTNSLTKERLENGDPEPDGVEAETIYKVVIGS